MKFTFNWLSRTQRGIKMEGGRTGPRDPLSLGFGTRGLSGPRSFQVPPESPLPYAAHRGFSRTELCALLSIVAVLTITFGTSLASSHAPGQRAGCANNLRQLGMAALIYSSENNGFFPARGLPRWTTMLQRYYGDLAALRCPNDGLYPVTFGGPTPADQAPRSYIFNGFNDYLGFSTNALPERAVHYPAATVLFGEKQTDSGHFWMDSWAFDDLPELEQGRHFRAISSHSVRGGSNYAMADGGVQFFKFGASFSPTNLWAVVDEYRNIPVTVP